jgi:hypothetical protein
MKDGAPSEPADGVRKRLSGHCFCQEASFSADDLFPQSADRRCDYRHQVSVGRCNDSGLACFRVWQCDGVIACEQGWDFLIREPPVANLGIQFFQPPTLGSNIAGAGDTEMNVQSFRAEEFNRLHKEM